MNRWEIFFLLRNAVKLCQELKEKTQKYNFLSEMNCGKMVIDIERIMGSIK